MTEAERMNDQQLCWQIDNVKKSTTLFDSQKNIRKTGDVVETKKSKNKHNILEQNNFIKNCEKAINGKQEWLKSSKNKKVFQNTSKFHPKSAIEFENTKKSNDKFNESVKNNDIEGSKRESEKQIEE